MKAMNTHISNPDVCERGCDVLMNITANGKIEFILMNSTYSLQNEQLITT